jgi:hypothetical protein
MNPRTIPVAAVLTVLTAAVIAPEIRAQSPAIEQVFEVTSIKLNAGCGGPGRGGGGMTQPGRIALECAELQDLILTAFTATATLPAPGLFGLIKVLGGPAWIDSDRYAIAAKAEGNPPCSQMYGPILRALLEDRFKLKVHRETRQVSGVFPHSRQRRREADGRKAWKLYFIGHQPPSATTNARPGSNRPANAEVRQRARRARST